MHLYVKREVKESEFFDVLSDCSEGRTWAKIF